MFFWLSKLFWIVFSPLTFVALLFCLGFAFMLLRPDNKWGLKTLLGASILFVLMAFFPLGYNTLVLLENESRQTKVSDNNQAIVVLGGCLEPIGRERIKRQFSYMNGACERLTEGLALHNKLNLPLVLSGGSGNPFNQEDTEAETAKYIFENLKIDQSSIFYEETSKNTHENALNLSQLKFLDKEKPIILITSASHMPRASRVFCTQNWEINPYSVNFQTDGSYKVFPNLNASHNISMFERAFKEVIGLGAYWITGKISLKACVKEVH